MQPLLHRQQQRVVGRQLYRAGAERPNLVGQGPVLQQRPRLQAQLRCQKVVQSVISHANDTMNFQSDYSTIASYRDFTLEATISSSCPWN